MTSSTRPPNKPQTPAPPKPPPRPAKDDATAALIADVEHQLSPPLHLLVAAVLDSDCDPVTRGHLNAAAQHVSLALSRLAHIESPARCDSEAIHPVASVVATPGGPGFTLPLRPAVPSFPHAPEPPFPGTPPGPPPQPDPRPQSQIGVGALYDALPQT